MVISPWAPPRPDSCMWPPLETYNFLEGSLCKVNISVRGTSRTQVPWWKQSFPARAPQVLGSWTVFWPHPWRPTIFSTVPFTKVLISTPGALRARFLDFAASLETYYLPNSSLSENVNFRRGHLKIQILSNWISPHPWRSNISLTVTLTCAFPVWVAPGLGSWIWPPFWKPPMSLKAPFV